MADLSADTFEQAPDPTRLLAAVLRAVGGRVTLGHVLEPVNDPAEEIHLEYVPSSADLDGYYVLSLRRRETFLDRATRVLTAAAADGVAYEPTARKILESLGADPDRLAP